MGERHSSPPLITNAPFASDIDANGDNGDDEHEQVSDDKRDGVAPRVHITE